MERFDDEEEVARVTEFLSTVEHIESLTGIDWQRCSRGRYSPE